MMRKTMMMMPKSNKKYTEFPVKGSPAYKAVQGVKRYSKNVAGGARIVGAGIKNALSKYKK